jgi:multidrug efflux pump subunit AcrB
MKKLVELFVKFPIWGNLLVLVIMILGVISLLKMNVNFFPEVESRIINIEVFYPGASPEEMEEGVVLKIEQALKGIQGIEQVTSVSMENTGNVTVEGKKGYKPETVLTDVKNAVDRISSLPVDAEKPVVYLRKQVERVATLLLQADVDLMTLKTNAELIEDELLASGVVTQLEIQGIPDREISIEVTEENLRRHQLKFDDIAAAVRRNNIDLSAGSIKASDEELLIRSRNKHYEASLIGDIILRSKDDGSFLRIRDIGTVKEQFADIPKKSIYNGNRAVTIQINKTRDEDMITVSDFVKQYILDYNERNEVLKLVMSNDTSKTVRQRIELLSRNGIIGLVLVVVVLGFFLNIRVASWVAFAIPVSFLGMFVIANIVGITINVVSLFGMILVIGILVDDGIVISENIYSHYEKGKKSFQAAVDGTMEVFPSVFASVSTTIVMFIPFFFLDGRMGEFFWEMAVVVIACLAISLVEGAFILPAHLAHSKGLSRKEPSELRKRIEKGIDYLRFDLYGRLLRKILKHKYTVTAGGVAFVLITAGLMSGGIIKMTNYPFVDSDNINIELQLPPGTREDKTLAILQEIEEKVWEVNKELSEQREDGNQVVLSTRIDFAAASEKGTIDVELLDGETRDLESFKISAAIRQKVGTIPEADKLTFGARQIFGKPVAVSLLGKDLKSLEEAKERFKEELRNFKTLRDVTDSDMPGKREVKLELKPLAHFLGLSVQDIARQVRQGFFGEEIQRLQVGNDEIKVWVRYPLDNRESIGSMEEVKIKVNGNMYPLTALVDYRVERGIVNINHMNGSREIKVEADLADQNEPVPPIIEKIKEEIAPMIMAEYPGVRVTFEGQDKELQKFIKSVASSFPLAFSMLLIIIVLTFRSWKQMLLVLLMIPLGIYGAFMGHGIEGKPISIFSFYGVIALTGVIVNDSVVFLDRFNRNLKLGLKLTEAVFQAGLARFRPIILTSLTTLAGLYPLISEKSRQAQFLIPMAISVAWGIVFVTIFVLFIFPNLILIVNDISRLFRWIWTGKKPEPEDVEPALEELREIKEEDH